MKSYIITFAFQCLAIVLVFALVLGFVFALVKSTGNEHYLWMLFLLLTVGFVPTAQQPVDEETREKVYELLDNWNNKLNNKR